MGSPESCHGSSRLSCVATKRHQTLSALSPELLARWLGCGKPNQAKSGARRCTTVFMLCALNLELVFLKGDRNLLICTFANVSPPNTPPAPSELHGGRPPSIHPRHPAGRRTEDNVAGEEVRPGLGDVPLAVVPLLMCHCPVARSGSRIKLGPGQLPRSVYLGQERVYLGWRQAGDEGHGFLVGHRHFSCSDYGVDMFC